MTRPAGYLINAPNNSGLIGEPGVFYDYILAGNGLFLRAKNAHLAVTICIADQLIRGLTRLEHSVELLHGKIPMHLVDLALSVLSSKPDIEQFLAVTWRGGYTLTIPEQTQTPGSVTYQTLPDAVLHIHSHTGDIPPDFSGIDDHDEQGFCIYAVAGDLRSLCPTVALRLGVYGYFLTLGNEEVFA